MKEQIQLLIAQHKMLREEANYEMNNPINGILDNSDLLKEIEMRSVFISELENLIS